MRGSRGGVGGSGGSGPPPPSGIWKLNIADITGNEKKLFFMCALPQLYVKVGPPPPGKHFSGSAHVNH